MEPRVNPRSGNEIGMLPGFGDAARVQNDDAVGPLDGRQAVSAHQRRPAAPERFPPPLYMGLRFGVEGGGRLPRAEHPPGLGERALDSDPVPLSAPNTHAAFSHN